MFHGNIKCLYLRPHCDERRQFFSRSTFFQFGGGRFHGYIKNVYRDPHIVTLRINFGRNTFDESPETLWFIRTLSYWGVYGMLLRRPPLPPLREASDSHCNFFQFGGVRFPSDIKNVHRDPHIAPRDYNSANLCASLWSMWQPGANVGMCVVKLRVENTSTQYLQS